jgi:hypothetical protein
VAAQLASFQEGMSSMELVMLQAGRSRGQDKQIVGTVSFTKSQSIKYVTNTKLGYTKCYVN